MNEHLGLASGGANPAISNKCVSSQSMPRSCPPYNPRCSKMFQMSWSISWPKFNLVAIKHWRCILGKTKMEQECRAHVLKSHVSNHWRLADFNMENYSLIQILQQSSTNLCKDLANSLQVACGADFSTNRRKNEPTGRSLHASCLYFIHFFLAYRTETHRTWMHDMQSSPNWPLAKFAPFSSPTVFIGDQHTIPSKRLGKTVRIGCCYSLVQL